GCPIRDELECAVSNVRANPGTAAVIRDLHCFYARGLVFWCPRVWPSSRSAVVLPLSTAMVALGTTVSAFWIMVNNSWMQVPVGYVVENGAFVPNDWAAMIFSHVVWVRFPHMLLAAYVTSAFCVAATGAWYVLRGKFKAESRVMLHMGLGLAAVLVPVQLLLGHFVGDYVHDKQPVKFAAIEARWHAEQPASETLIGRPDPDQETNRYAISIPYLGSLIGSMSLTRDPPPTPEHVPDTARFTPATARSCPPFRAAVVAATEHSHGH